MGTSYKVTIRKTFVYKGQRKTTHYVRWTVDGKEFKEPFTTNALAESFRSKLVTAARDGEAFDTTEGLPLKMLRTETPSMSCYDFASGYMDTRWWELAPKSRRSTVDSLIPITRAMVSTERGAPSIDALNRALRWTLNPQNAGLETPTDFAAATAWLKRNSRPVGDLGNPDVLRKLLASFELNVDGAKASLNTIRLRRTTLRNMIGIAIEQKLLGSNPLDEVKTKKTKATLAQVDRRSVANPVQARTLLRAMEEVDKRLVAFFGAVYFAGLRPEEALNLREEVLTLPEGHWGTIHLEKAAPEVAAQWTDSGTANEERSLKHRAETDSRTVPCCPELTDMLRRHIRRFGTTEEGYLFRGARGGRLGSTVYSNAWAKAREKAFTAEVFASPLAKRPYDLRHACLSTWLNAGVEPTRVAQWAGNSLRVLLHTYAKCFDGGEQAALDRVEALLTPKPQGGNDAR
ncbi:tyrosine-type recombinase/integrase [Kutzneria sp. CA-103260]|uniref:tyrosine-type recombinase/integrase n=1 Tax=Kutzneria sp. CA-103260 TaxID=2802641 RepID=UPI001BA9436B|nr:tyrosine-type recombinase/integrase [Kutzneria sp. CA-103260]QUQ70570.1 integrase [Kutzneria sp. CA-103260]